MEVNVVEVTVVEEVDAVGTQALHSTGHRLRKASRTASASGPVCRGQTPVHPGGSGRPLHVGTSVVDVDVVIAVVAVTASDMLPCSSSSSSVRCSCPRSLSRTVLLAVLCAFCRLISSIVNALL